jgi:hypothetical protein
MVRYQYSYASTHKCDLAELEGFIASAVDGAGGVIQQLLGILEQHASKQVNSICNHKEGSCASAECVIDAQGDKPSSTCR